MIKQIIVGLGNPETQHQKSRHNAGWLAIDELADKNTWQKEKKFKALINKQTETIYVKPLTYMNLSGESVFKITNYFNLLPKKFGLIIKKNSDLKDNLIVIHDDLDINLGEFKIVDDSGSAGHRGVQSIINHLGTQKFKRLRLGIKTPALRQIIPSEKFVLQNFNQTEIEALIKTFKQAWQDNF